jgi:uncharacterized protein with NAD-binding domain and iron-sulfur cluster
MGSLSAVLQLTQAKDWKTRYDITIYQTGWRLGGKGASGRSVVPEFHHRIEEHGVHMFFGFYTNAFRLMEACYDELARPAGSLFVTWKDAFKGMNNVVLAEEMPDRTWAHWCFRPPRTSGQPTDDRSSPDLGDYIERVAEWARQELLGLFTFSRALPPSNSLETEQLQRKLDLHAEVIEQLAAASLVAAGKISERRARIVQAPRRASTFSATPPGLEDEIEELLASTVNALRSALGLVWWLFSETISQPDSDLARVVRKTWIICNFIYANLNGIHESRLLRNGIETINVFDYRQWVTEHGVQDGGAMRKSSLVRWLYDALFSYRSGDICKPSMEAGTALLTLIRLVLTYSGEFLYKMQAGMGDVVFAPIYEVLAKRGVKFEFFHRVVSLEVGNDLGRKVVSRIHFECQARTKAGAGMPYAPLIQITDSEGKTLPCWPAEPDYGQLEGGDALRDALNKSNTTLENYATSPHARSFCLERHEFDDVVLGIGLGAAPHVCADLISEDPDWKKMVSNVGTVSTLGVQLWLDRELGSLVPDSGSPLATPAIFCGFDYDEKPIDSYADMTQVLPRESWPAGSTAPKSIAYFCSPLKDMPSSRPFAAADTVRDLALTMLSKHINGIWPGSITRAGAFDWNRLVDLRSSPSTDEGRLEAQYFVGIANPSDRYVTSFEGSSSHRLWPDRTGFDNLTLTGDWVRNTFNIGCIEATVMSGFQAANVIRRLPLGDGIAGWGLFSKDRP